VGFSLRLSNDSLGTYLGQGDVTVSMLHAAGLWEAAHRALAGGWEAGTELGLLDGVLTPSKTACSAAKQHAISHSPNSSLEPGLAALQLWEAAPK